tara:strand:- start:344 stop:547 length:204 start_codon:yes stop_codon:yes gene_type:complete
MTVTIKLMLIILLWNNDGSFQSSVAEVSTCPEIESFTEFMEEKRTVGQFKSWTAYCEQVQFGHDLVI